LWYNIHAKALQPTGEKMTYQEELYLKLDEQANKIISELPSFSKLYFNHMKTLGQSQRSRVQYAYDMKRFFDFLKSQAGFKDVNFKTASPSDVMDKLSIQDIEEYLDSLEYYTVRNDEGKEEKRIASPSVKARRISSLRSFYKYYFKIGEIKNNLADVMDIPKIPDKQISVLDKEQVGRMLAAVKDIEGYKDLALKKRLKTLKRDYAIVMLFFGTGLRVSELVGINVNDIDFYEASIIVTRKGGDQDVVFFGPEVQCALEDYYSNDRTLLLGKNTGEKAFFISTKNKRISVRSVEEMIQNYARKAGINTKVSPHALRRSFGTYLYDATGDIYLVADALHHTSVETTKKHYARMSKDHKRIAAKQSSGLFQEDEESKEICISGELLLRKKQD